MFVTTENSIYFALLLKFIDMDAKKYNNIKLFISISKAVLTFVLVLWFLLSGLSTDLVEFLRGYTENEYLLFIIFVIVTGFGMSVLFFPLNFYSEFILEHKYKLSNQNIWQWAWENVKSTIVGGIIGLPLLLVFYYSLCTFGDYWWLPFTIILFLFSVVLAKFLPVVILPLFYKVKPLENNKLKEKVNTLAQDAGMKIENLYQFNMSKNTKKANAMFTGLGKTKKIILGDTLLEKFNNDEIETVIAHELGHYKYKHIIKNLIIGAISSFLTFYLMAYFYKLSLPWFGFSEITQIDAIPLLTLWAMLIGLILEPLTNIISRHFEYEADRYAVISTRKKEVFIKALEKLTEQNLSDKDPHPFVEWFFYSHPSIKNRIRYLRTIKI